MRDSMVFYRSFHEATKDLPPDIYKEAMVALMDYALDGKIGELSPFANMFLQMAKPQVDANNQKYANGCKGGRKASKAEEIHSDSKPSEKQEEIKLEPIKNQEETKPEPNLTKAEPNDNVYDNDNVLKENTLKGVKEKRFTPPTVEQVTEYCQKSDITSVDVQRFVDFYTSKDWMIGKNRMKNWQAAVRNWARQDVKPKEHASKTQKPNRFLNFAQRETDYEALVMDQVHGWLDQAKGA